MNPVFTSNCNFAEQAINNLNKVIELLKKKDLKQGHRKLNVVIAILNGMNSCYDRKYVISVEEDGTRYFQPTILGSSAAYNYAKNEGNIAKIKRCISLLESPNPNMGFVIDVLKGNREI